MIAKLSHQSSTLWYPLLVCTGCQDPFQSQPTSQSSILYETGWKHTHTHQIPFQIVLNKTTFETPDTRDGYRPVDLVNHKLSMNALIRCRRSGNTSYGVMCVLFSTTLSLNRNSTKHLLPSWTRNSFSQTSGKVSGVMDLKDQFWDFPCVQGPQQDSNYNQDSNHNFWTTKWWW